MTSDSSIPTAPSGAADAHPRAIEDLDDLTAENIHQRAGAASSPELKEVLSEARRRQTSSGLSDAELRRWTAVIEGVNQELAARRLASRVDRIEAVERREPLRRRILDLLALAPHTPTDLARALDVARESVSRALRELSNETLVVSRPDPDDARVKVYSATGAGRAALAEHRAFGAPVVLPAPPTDFAVRDHLVELATAADEEVGREELERARVRAEVVEREASHRGWTDLVERAQAVLTRVAHPPLVAQRELVDEIHRAVELRRTGARSAAIPALEAVCGSAVANGWARIELRGRAELMSALRQDSRLDELEAQFVELRTLRFGTRPVPGIISVIASAHEAYERGRRPSSLASEREHYESLVAAHVGYSDLVALEPDEPEWRKRRGWASLSVAENLRRQTYHGRALYHVRSARQDFDADDAYGRARALFIEGFCMKLQGKFDAAREPLEEALERVRERGYQPFEADILAQLGDLDRCTHQLEDAVSQLEEAQSMGDELRRPVTSAFAESALGAVAFADERIDDAIELLQASEDTFTRVGHDAGRALTTYRLATALRDKSPDATDASGRAALDLYRESLSIYEVMGSPAGAAGCLVGELRLYLQCDEDPGPTTRRLQAVMRADRAHSLLLRLDPFVPTLIHDLARVLENRDLVEYRDLIEMSDELDASAAAHIERRETDSSSARPAAVQPAQRGNEMACEPRRDADEPGWVHEALREAA